jgi:hypothetical protein
MCCDEGISSGRDEHPQLVAAIPDQGLAME